MSKKVCTLFFTAAGLLMSLYTVAQPHAFEWAVKASNVNTTEIYGVATDVAGYVYVTGQFSDVVDFDPGTGVTELTAVGEEDVFIVKYSPAGDLVWARQVGGDLYEGSVVIATDSLCNVYVGGQFQDLVDFDPGTGVHNLICEGEWDAFILKLDSAGSFGWARRFGGAGTWNGSGNTVRGISIDPAGNVYATGNMNGLVDFDPDGSGYLLQGTGETDIFVSKLSGAGNLIWAKRIGGFDYAYGNAIAADAVGNIFVTGIFADEVDFDPANTPSFRFMANGGYDVFVSRFDTSGRHIWTKAVGGSSSDAGTSIAADDAGGVYISGHFRNAVNFNPGGSTPATLTSAGMQDVFVYKLDTAGNYTWARHMGGKGNDFSHAISLDRAGNVITGGRFADTADFDPGADTVRLISAGGTDAFISKLDAAGHYLWAGKMGGTSGENVYALDIDRAGNVYTGGYFGGTADMDPGAGTVNLVSNGGQSAFLQKLVCADTSFYEITDTVCNASYEFLGNTYAQSGNYVFHLVNAAGCDSTVILHLTVGNVVALISVDGFELSATQSYDSYRWLNAGDTIAGATGRSYVVTENGAYALVVADENGCSDTSAVHHVNNVMVGAAGDVAARVTAYPNPVRDVLYIHAPFTVRISLFSSDGKILIDRQEGNSMNVAALPGGVYFIQVRDEYDIVRRTERIYKVPNR